MKSCTLIVFSLFLLWSCKNKEGIPSDVLPHKQMKAIIWDMMRADQFLSDFILNRDSAPDKKTESVKLYQQVLAIHDITKEKFQKSFDYYQSHPGLLKNIMEALSKDSLAGDPRKMVNPLIIADSL